MTDARSTRLQHVLGLARRRWAQIIAFAASRWRRAAHAMRTGWAEGGAGQRGGPGPAPGVGELGERVSELARRAVASDVDEGVEVPLPELLHAGEHVTDRAHR